MAAASIRENRSGSLKKNQTEISITGQLKPKFWIPPVIEVYFLDKVFNKQITETMAKLERKTK